MALVIATLFLGCARTEQLGEPARSAQLTGRETNPSLTKTVTLWLRSIADNVRWTKTNFISPSIISARQYG
jgi:hypothetical protein